MIVLKYSLTPEDHYRFNYYRIWQSPSQKRVRLGIYLRLIFYMFLVIVVIHLLSNRPVTLQDVVIATLLILVGCLLLPEANRLSIKRRIDKLLSDEKNASYLALTEHVISDEGIYTKDDYSETKYNWSSFVSREETKDYYYLFIDSLKAIAVPKRIFISKEEESKFQYYLSTYLSVKAEFETLKHVHNVN
jgi:hypothetical protein